MRHVKQHVIFYMDAPCKRSFYMLLKETVYGEANASASRSRNGAAEMSGLLVAMVIVERGRSESCFTV